MKRRKNKPPTKSAVDYIELLYNKYAPKLKYVAKQYIHNDTLAEDVLQNVFEKALLYSEKILELPDEKAFTFLYVIVRNTAYDMIKVESRNNHEELTYEDGEDSEYLIDPNDYYMEYIDLNVMVDKIGRLPTNQQTVLILYYYYGFSFLEIATLLQISELTAKKRCSLARSSLRALFEKEGLSFMSTNDKKDKNEELFDHIIEYGAGRWTDEISPDNIPEEKLSDQLNQKIDTIFSSARKRANRKRRFITARRIAAVFVVLLTMASITVMSVEAFREPVINFIFKTQNKKDETELKITEEPSNSQEVDFVFNYMPDGYVLEKKVVDQSTTNLSYQYKNGDDSILIDIIIDPSINVYKYVKDQNYKTIKTTDAKYFYIEGDYNQLVWSRGKVIYTIFSTLDNEKMIKIGENIKRIK